jgi:predicted transposase/invertase (TIGR01784 family)
MQLVMLAAYHPTVAWMEQVARLLGALASLALSGGINYVRIFVLYILATQEPEVAQSFRDVLRQHAPEVGDELMTYAQELVKEGREEGEIRAEVRIIENLLRERMEWSAIERITGVSETQFQALKQRLEGMNQ